MKGFFSLFTDSAKELKSIRCLTVTGIFIAISMVIEAFTIQLPYAKINFAFLAIAVIGMLFGPSVGLLAGGACDIVGYLVHPEGAFMPIYILVAMLQGMLYGMLLYQRNQALCEKKLQLCIRIVIARLLDVAIINLVLNTTLNYHYGFIHADTLQAAMVARIVKNLVELAADLPLMLLLLPIALTAYRFICRGSVRMKTAG